MSKRENSDNATGSPSPLVGEGARDAKHRGRVRGSSLSKNQTSRPAPASGVRHPKSELRSPRLPQGERVTSQAEKKVCIARIGAAHGVRGQVKLWTFTEQPLSVTRYGALSTKNGARQFEVTHAREAKGYLVATLRGITTRSEAERLNGVELYVARDKLPETADSEYYHADLIGLAAVTPAGEPLGRVVAIHNFGAGDIIEIAPPAGTSMLLPFSNAVVPTVDVAGGRVVIDLPGEIEGEQD